MVVYAGTGPLTYTIQDVQGLRLNFAITQGGQTLERAAGATSSVEGVRLPIGVSTGPLSTVCTLEYWPAFDSDSIKTAAP